MNREELTDELAEAIGDSLDMDWRSSDGARAVIDRLLELGLISFEPSAADQKLVNDRLYTLGDGDDGTLRIRGSAPIQGVASMIEGEG